MVEIYTDGGCRPTNPGPGGWGLVICRDGYLACTKSGTEAFTTNNRMELTAILEAFNLIEREIQRGKEENYISLISEDDEVVIYSDSAYCVRIYNEWMHTWARNSWLNSKKKEIENKDLVLRLYNNYNKNFQPFQVKKVQGHSNIWQNELADALSKNDQRKIDRIKEMIKNDTSII